MTYASSWIREASLKPLFYSAFPPSELCSLESLGWVMNVECFNRRVERSLCHSCRLYLQRHIVHPEAGAELIMVCELPSCSSLIYCFFTEEEQGSCRRLWTAAELYLFPLTIEILTGRILCRSSQLLWVQECSSWGLRDGTVVKKTCSFRGPWFNSQNLHQTAHNCL